MGRQFKLHKSDNLLKRRIHFDASENTSNVQIIVIRCKMPAIEQNIRLRCVDKFIDS